MLSATSDRLRAALACQQRGQLLEAERLCHEVVTTEPEHAEALHLLGVLALQTHRPELAVEWLHRSLRCQAQQPEVQLTLGLALRMLGRTEEALASYDQALLLRRDDPRALSNRGNVLRQLSRFDAARASYEHGLRVDPNYPPALFNYGNLLLELGDYEAALERFERLLQLQPNDAEALAHRGVALLRLGRADQAVASLDRAFALRPDLLSVLNNRTSVLIETGRLEEALACGRLALQAAPADADALNNQAEALRLLQRHDEVAACLSRLLERSPGYDYALGNLVFSRRHDCDWEGLEALERGLRRELEEGRRAALPMCLLAIMDVPELQLRGARGYVAHKYPARDPTPLTLPGSSAPAAPAVSAGTHAAAPGRLRVAYVSGDFGEHPVALSLVGVLEQHDRERCEIIGVSLRSHGETPFTRRLVSAFDRLIDARGMSDRQLAAHLRALPVDIAVDLCGFTHGMRLGVFAHRPAPVQVSYLGYAGTLGAPYIDYLLADDVVVPPGAECWYAEQIVRLPHCYLPMDDRRESAVSAPSRAAAGLPDQGLVLCAFTNTYKISPAMFDIWMRLLAAVPASVLWLRADRAQAVENLRREAGRRGVSPDRLVFAPRVAAMPEHLARQSLADLFLDTLPYNAHSTACDALWSGVPVLTCAGRGFAARVAASALTAAGLPELITHSLEEYERRALELAAAPERLAALKARLLAARARAPAQVPLFDVSGYARALEAAYRRMAERSRQGAPPASFALGSAVSAAA